MKMQASVYWRYWRSTVFLAMAVVSAGIPWNLAVADGALPSSAAATVPTPQAAPAPVGWAGPYVEAGFGIACLWLFVGGAVVGYIMGDKLIAYQRRLSCYKGIRCKRIQDECVTFHVVRRCGGFGFRHRFGFGSGFGGRGGRDVGARGGFGERGALGTGGFGGGHR